MRFGYKIIPAEGPKAATLVTDHAAIMVRLQGGSIMTLQKDWVPDNDYESLQDTVGQETLCAHLAEMKKVTGIPALDNHPSVWQVNYGFLEIIPGTHLTNNGDKLWLHIMVVDVSGRVETRMNEKVALTVSGLANRDAFLRALVEGDPVFPTVASLKLARKIKYQERTEGEGDTNQGDEERSTTFVNITILEAAPQDPAQRRTNTVRQLIPFMRSLTTLPAAILPAALHMLIQSNIYPCLVQYPSENLEPQACQKAWVIVKANTKSKCTEDPPYVVTTEDVEDALAIDAPPLEGSDPMAKKYKLVSMCNKEGRTSLMLTPSHGKPAFALAVITAVNATTLFAETVETFSKDDKDAMLMSIRQEMTLAVALMENASKGSEALWSDTTSPLAASRCRHLGKSPTGPELDAMDARPKKCIRTD
jgi:hypothetical protein